MIADEIRFAATEIDAYREDGIDGIYFGEGDPDEGGQHWHFSRGSADNEDDWGVCTVKEIQQATCYGGIRHYIVTRREAICEFDERAAAETRTRRLVIGLDVDDETWSRLKAIARLVFRDESYAKIE